MGCCVSCQCVGVCARLFGLFACVMVGGLIGGSVWLRVRSCVCVCGCVCLVVNVLGWSVVCWVGCVCNKGSEMEVLRNCCSTDKTERHSEGE